MPSAHFECPTCGWRGERVYPSADVGTPRFPPTCLARSRKKPRCKACLCGARLVQAPRPSDFSGFDIKTDGEGGGRGAGFQKFTVHRQVPTKDGLVQVREEIDSLHKVRQLEKDSEQRYRNGEGEPMRFRGYAMDRSNKDVGAFGREGSIGGRAYDSGKTPQRKKNVGVKRHGQGEPNVSTAKGGGVSPLGE